MQVQGRSAAEEGDFMKMRPSEQEAVDVHPHGVEGSEHHKQSMVGKVKDKAKKLKSKIKGATKKKDEHGNELEDTSSTSSAEDEEHHGEGVQRQTMGSELKKEVAVHGGRHQSPEVEQTSREMAGLDLGKTEASRDPDAPAVGAQWSSSIDEPRAATNVPLSSEETSKRQDEVPAAPGQESAGVSSVLSADPKEDEVAAGRPAGDDRTGGKWAPVPEGIMKPRSENVEPMEGYKPVHDVVDSSGRDVAASEDVKGRQEQAGTKSPSEHGSGGISKGEGAALGVAGVGAGAAAAGHAASKEGDQAVNSKGWMQRASESVASVKNAITSKISSPRAGDAAKGPEDKSLMESPGETTDKSSESAPQQARTWTDEAKDTVVSAKETVASKLPASIGGSGTTATDAPGGATAGQTQKPVTARAMETATGLKDAVAAKLGYAGRGESPQASPQAVGAESATDTTKPTVTEKVLGSVTGVKDTLTSKLGYGGGSEVEAKGVHDQEQQRSKMFTPDEDDTALSQKITDMLSLGGGSKGSESTTTTGTAAATSPADETQGKGYMERVSGVVGSLMGGKKAEDKPATATGSDPGVRSSE